MPKVIVRIKGGLGNQLFCYAAARRLAIANDAELVIDDVTGFVRDLRYHRKYTLGRFQIPARRAMAHERMEPFEKYRRGLAKLIAKHRAFRERRYIEQEGKDFDPRLLYLKVRGTVYLDGLWQSEGYFNDVADVIRKDLALVPPDDSYNLEVARRIPTCNAVAVHVRWFEGPDAANREHNVGPSYYGRAVQEIRARAAAPHFFIFSDQPEAARQMLDLPEGQATCVSHNRGDESVYADLWLMSQCKHFIIANSTFSWWGAWLSQSERKVVIVPRIVQSGISSWGFKGLIPAEWISMSLGTGERN